MGRVHNQQFQGTTLLIVFDFLGNVNKKTLQVAETGHISGNNKHSFTPLKFNIAYLQNDGWKTILSFWVSACFEGYFNFRGCKIASGYLLWHRCSSSERYEFWRDESFPTKSVTANVAGKQLGGNTWGLIIP